MVGIVAEVALHENAFAGLQGRQSDAPEMQKWHRVTEGRVTRPRIDVPALVPPREFDAPISRLLGDGC